MDMDRSIHRALQDVEIAKEYIITNDYVAARKILLNVQCYHPAFDDISGMISVCDILHSAGYDFLGCDADYYWILQVSPYATDHAINTRYKRLYALLEPIMGNFPCSASALRIIHDAFSVLSNPNKRSVFDMKRAKKLQAYGSGNFQEIHVGSTEKCLLRREAFLESRRSQCDMLNDDSANFEPEIDGFSTKFPWDGTSTIDNKQDSHESVTRIEDFAVGQLWAIYDNEGMPRNYAQIVNVKLKVHESPCRVYVSWLKPIRDSVDGNKGFEAGLSTVCGIFNVDRSCTSFIRPNLFSHRLSATVNESELVEIYPIRGEVWAIYSNLETLEGCFNPKASKGCELLNVEILTGYSHQVSMLVAGLVKVEGEKNVYKSDNSSESYFQIPGRNLYMFSHRIPAHTFADESMAKTTSRMFKLDPLADANSIINRSTSLRPAPQPLSVTEQMHKKRSSKEFFSGQIWAIYDGPNSMPTRYVIVNNVYSESEICVTFLEPHPVSVNERHWIKENLPYGCGLFKTGKIKHNLKLCRFSHTIKCKDNELYYKIYPKKGEIWAKYKNWRVADFNEHHCQIVEIVSDFSEECGLIAVNLEKVASCSTFFHRQSYEGFELVREVPVTEMLSFSHRIPAYTVPGAEMRNIPKGSWHLEPDALPPNFSHN
ncbi:uncharacterized protein LOC126682428 [Mercurialis annua]|uniref:uncharacterized protein LOC126682428 n=1 Tax=Mercurialis annua TaxID=3986 RepID=UPI00215F2D5C|nr:uncharacterized protein LOC126682428 [Mercurialis annua]